MGRNRKGRKYSLEARGGSHLRRPHISAYPQWGWGTVTMPASSGVPQTRRIEACYSKVSRLHMGSPAMLHCMVP